MTERTDSLRDFAFRPRHRSPHPGGDLTNPQKRNRRKRYLFEAC